MSKAYIALGTNIEPRTEYINQALALLSRHDRITMMEKSSIYETAPVGYVDQAHFLNLVIEVRTSLSPIEMLDVCQSIEQQLGRERTVVNGPRTIDLDILVYNEENIRTGRLVVPHPRMNERAFVLIPLEEIAPELSIPGLGKTVKELCSDLSKEDKLDVVRWT